MTVIEDILRPAPSFLLQTPARLKRHIAHALTRGLTELQPQAPQLTRLAIYANGPTALDASLMHRPSMALNGALGLFTQRGLAPDFWVALDDSPIVARFLENAPRQTVYFVASRCHPSVFDALKGREIVLWHVAEAKTAGFPWGYRPLINGGTSVTLTAFSLAHVMGFQGIDVYGWDGAYRDGADHAIPQPHDTDHATINIGGPEGTGFDTSGTWLVEAKSALWQLSQAEYEVRIHGDSMFGAILRHNRVGQVEYHGR